MMKGGDEEREEGGEKDGTYTSAIIGAPKTLQMTSTLVSACWKGSSTTGLCLLEQHTTTTTSYVGSTERFHFCLRYGPAPKAHATKCR
jgi:hypothetical protein